MAYKNKCFACKKILKKGMKFNCYYTEDKNQYLVLMCIDCLNDAYKEIKEAEEKQPSMQITIKEEF